MFIGFPWGKLLVITWFVSGVLASEGSVIENLGTTLGVKGCVDLGSGLHNIAFLLDVLFTGSWKWLQW
jgi:hypothetical protein